MQTMKERHERAFDAFAEHGDHITFESYTGQGRKLAAIRGDDPESPTVALLTDQLESMWDQFATVADTNHDGVIDRDEWDAFSVGMTATLRAVGPDDESPLDPYVRRLFDVIDADGDGRITEKEYGDWLASLGLAADTDIAGAFANLDDNGDGTLSWQEFSVCGRNYWTNADPDLPGARWMGP